MKIEDREQIIKYVKRGWSIFPVSLTTVEENGKTKKEVHFPVTDGKEGWKRFQNTRITEDQIDWEWMSFDQCGVATGKISGISCIDLDTKDMTKIPLEFFNTYVVESNKGFHLYYKYHPDVKQTQSTVENIDIRSDGGFLFCPPTRYKLPDGTLAEYKVINDIPLADFPIDWYQKTFNQEKNNWKEKFVQPLTTGSRNMDFASIIGGLLMRFPMDEWESVVWPTVMDKNKLQEKPLSPAELRTTFNSITKTETQRRHQGGDIKDIIVTSSEDDMRVDIRLESCLVCFKIKNIISSLSEATSIAWIQKATGLTHEIPFYLKIRSDTNKEQWVRILSKAFDHKENKETYPWTIIVAKVVSAVETQIRTRQQVFQADTIQEKDYAWLLEPFVQEDQINTFFGMGGSGKTLLTLYFAKKIAELLGHNILFIDYEDSMEAWKGKLVKITEENDFDHPISKFFYFNSEQIPIADQVDKIRDAIKTNDIKLVIVDSASLATGESTSDEKATVRLFSALKLLRTTVILIAHQRKNHGDETPIGSIQYENQSRNVWNIAGNIDDKDNSIIHAALKHTKANNTYKRPNAIGYMITYGDKIVIKQEDARTHFPGKYTVTQKIEFFLLNEGEFDYKEIAAAIGEKPGTVNTALIRGLTNGLFEKDGEMYSIKKTIINETVK